MLVIRTLLSHFQEKYLNSLTIFLIFLKPTQKIQIKLIANQVYYINQNDKILSTDNNWDEFAKENSSETYGDSVMGESIWQYISNKKVQKLYRSIFQSVRNSGEKIILDFRCDSEKVIRHMQLSIEKVTLSILKIQTSLIRAVPRKRVLSSPILYIGVQHATPMCSSCNKVFISSLNKWIEIDEALTVGKIPDPLSVRFDLCDKCAEYMQRKIAEVEGQ
jgi:hypothetical protein